jgi:hypothetical protein
MKKNLHLLRNIFAVNCRVHLQPRLRKMIEEEMAKRLQ